MGSTSTHGVVEVAKKKKSNNVYAIFAARPLASGTQQAGCRQAATHWSGRRSRDCNLGPATPSDVRGNRRIIVSCPRSWRNSRPRPLSGQMESLGDVRCDDAAWEGIFFCPPQSASRRISPCRSLGQERSCRAGYEVVKVRPLCRPSKIGQDALQCFPHSWCSSLDGFPHRLRLFGGQVAVRQVVTIWQ